MLVSLSSSTRVKLLDAWPHFSPFISPFFHFNYRRSSPPLISVHFSPRRFRRLAISPGRPPPPDSDNNDSGSASTTRLQESMRIFFAVLFWMTLFFWSAIWDGRDNNGGTSTRPRKGSWFRR